VTGPIAGRGILLAEEAEPGQEMGIAAELGKLVQAGKSEPEGNEQLSESEEICRVVRA
jgi:hypothetical protein